MPREFELYVTPEGKIPFSDWLETLKDKRAKAEVKRRLDRVIEGNLGDHKFIGEKLFELRITYGPGYRIYCGEVEGKIIVLLCAGDKSTQSKDIEEAKEYWANYTGD